MKLYKFRYDFLKGTEKLGEWNTPMTQAAKVNQITYIYWTIYEDEDERKVETTGFYKNLVAPLPVTAKQLEGMIKKGRESAWTDLVKELEKGYLTKYLYHINYPEDYGDGDFSFEDYEASEEYQKEYEKYLSSRRDYPIIAVAPMSVLKENSLILRHSN